MINSIKQKAEVMVMHKSVDYILVCFIVMAALFYIYFADIAVRTVTSLEKTKTQMQSLSVLVSEMESRRLTAENNISTEKALRLGLVEVNNPTFIIKSSQKTALSLKID